MSHRNRQPTDPPAEDTDLLPPRLATTLLLCIVCLVAVFRINLIDIPFERDEGAYIYFGQSILQGQTPYLDFYEDKPPGNMYFYALMVWLFGPGEGSLHAGFMLLNIATLLMLYGLTRRLFGSIPALCGAAAFATLSLSYGVSGFSCMSEHIVIFFAAAAMGLLLGRRRQPRPREDLLAGIALGMACWVRQSAIFLLAWGAAAAWMTHRHGPASRWRRLLWFSAGAAAVSLFFLALMERLGVFRQFWLSAVELPRLFVTQELPRDDVLRQLTGFANTIFRDNPLVVAAACVGSALLAFTDRPREEKAALGLLLALSLLTVVPGMMFYNHYWLQVVPAAALAVAAAIAASSKLLSRLSGRSLWACTLALLVVFALGKALMVAKKSHYYFGNDYPLILRRTYGDNPFTSSKRIGEYLRNRTKPGDKIAVFGSEPQIFLYSRCRNATRHAFVTHLVNPRNPYAAAWQKEYMADVAKAAPKYIVVVNHPASWCCSKDFELCRKFFDRSNAYLKRHYETVGVAEIHPAKVRPRFFWDEDMRDYRPKSPLSLFVFKRRRPI